MIDGILIGMPALAEHGDIREDFSLCKRLGLDFVELNANLPRCMLSRLHPAAVRARATRPGSD
jgi:predicted xylose isomerase-like sugar epimerase